MLKKYSIITYGCQMNESDSERIASTLENKGCKKASNINGADLIVVNMCSVRQSAVDRVYGKIKDFTRLKKENPKLKIVLTGCILRRDRNKFRKIFVKEDKSSFPAFAAARVFDEIWSNRNYINILPKRQIASVAYIPISNGCNNSCTYCVVPFTRGPLVCRNHKEILKEVKNAVNPVRNRISNGAREIWLLGQNVNDYTSPKNSSINFPKLLKQVSEIPGDFKIKFTSPNPKNFSDELINVMAKSEKIAHYLNLPVQSGDNKILRRMNRPYTVDQYKKLVKKIRKKIPDIFLSTDIIVGFPSETKRQFGNTVKLFREMNFDMAYISKFSPRPGTAASKIKSSISPEEKGGRWKILNDILLENWKKKKLILILGPTASGKSALAVKLAKKFNGEIISADSRQVYKGMDIGTGKMTKKEMQGIPHYLLDVVSPQTRFSVALYRKLALKEMDKIFKRNKVPILCGGTGFYIQAVVDGIVIPSIKPDWKLRKKLEEMTSEELFKKLKKVDPKRARTIDRKNKRRLIRAWEIVAKTKRPVPAFKTNPLPYPVLMLGIKKEKTELRKLINKRLLKRLKQGMVEEVKKLRKSGVSWKRLEEFGLEYRFVAQYLQKKIRGDGMVNFIQKESENFAKRQMTWFKRDKRIKWIKSYSEAKNLVKTFLKKK